MGSLIRLILGILAIWFLYKLIFEFIVPVYRGTKQVRRQMRDMQDAMRQQFEQQQRQQQQQQQAGPQVPPQAQEPARKRDDGDYIDFEEIK